ncbi:MAG: hypothetical protein E6Q59_10110 [Nitrosomonas sp.]|nr:MAG: hypothetical protein E6Q59_10110 [Nitrosomonas sp.]
MELKLRLDEHGGGVRQPDIKDLENLLCVGRVLLLVHGYNNDYYFARDIAYPAFESLQRKIAGVGPNGDYAPGWTVCKVYWPGDADFGLVSALFYPWIVKNAPVTGRALARLLHAAAGSGNLEVAIVSHSLGCRVVAELLTALPAGSGVRVTRVAFFAAALGTDKLEDRSVGSLGNAIDTKVEDSVLSLYSDSDMVLGYAFPLGQTLANDGFMPVALGHDLWASTTVPGGLSQAQNVRAGHSSYWGWEDKTRDDCGRRANEAAREALRLGRFAERLPPERQVQIRSSTEARALATRQTGVPNPYGSLSAR